MCKKECKCVAPVTGYWYHPKIKDGTISCVEKIPRKKRKHERTRLQSKPPKNAKNQFFFSFFSMFLGLEAERLAGMFGFFQFGIFYLFF